MFCVNPSLIVDYVLSNDALTTPQTLLWVYSAREPKPSTLARAVLQSQIFSDGRVADAEGLKLLLWKMIEEELPNSGIYMDETFWNVENPFDQRYKCARVVDFFIEQAAHVRVLLVQKPLTHTCSL